MEKSQFLRIILNDIVFKTNSDTLFKVSTNLSIVMNQSTPLVNYH